MTSRGLSLPFTSSYLDLLKEEVSSDGERKDEITFKEENGDFSIMNDDELDQEAEQMGEYEQETRENQDVWNQRNEQLHPEDIENVTVNGYKSISSSRDPKQQQLSTISMCTEPSTIHVASRQHNNIVDRREMTPQPPTSKIQKGYTTRNKQEENLNRSRT
ncbi:hypothetical protein KQX54_000645 [Cotesia glomerata]|uniref:Uncharacterized protein n=1 Tax=Cotesia glomerata TaxID=32391 RepID=A0AAV7J0Z8_COTGL|nr:hypothetical protein KQX54_000645 [Cotesia glomerata]